MSPDGRRAAGRKITRDSLGHPTPRHYPIEKGRTPNTRPAVITSVRIVLLVLSTSTAPTGTLAPSPPAPGRIPTPARARQHPAGPRVPLGPRDSADLVSTVRKHQERFERLRRQHLPRTFPTYGRCDERIGRYCIRHTDADWVPPAEPGAVLAARAELLTLLDSASSVLPGDGWIVGQHVRYLVEAGRPADAVATTQRCLAPEPWWCPALAGYAHHSARDYHAAEKAFSRALAMLPTEERCEWIDLSRILEGDLRDRYRKLDCAGRAPLDTAILWLADPLYGVPGNELFTEHLSRHVYSRLVRRAATPEGDRWGTDLHRFIVRYGWPAGWERVWARITDTGPPSVVSHFGRGARYFLPRATFVDDPSTITCEAWDLDPQYPRAGHTPGYTVSGFLSRDLHLAVFERGDSAVVVAAYHLVDDSIPDDAAVDALLIVKGPDGATRGVTRRELSGKEGTLALTVPTGSHLLGLEVLAREERRAARARYGLPIDRRDASRFALSDVLLTFVTDSLPESLADAVAAARPPRTLHPGTRLGLYWEAYGLADDTRIVRTTLSLVRQGRSIFRRVAEAVGVASDRPPVRLTWQDRNGQMEEFFARAIALDLPAELSEGEYALRLEARLGDGRVATTERRFVVRAPER